MTANLYKIAQSLIFAVLFSSSLYAQLPLSVVQIAGSKAQTRTSLEGDNPYSLAYAMFVLNPASKELAQKKFGITNEQIEALKEKNAELFGEAFDRDLWLSLEKKREENPNFVASREEQRKLEAMFSKQLGDEFNKKVLEAVLTPQQMKKVEDYAFIVRGGIRYPRHNEKTLAFLDLTEEQKNEIRKYREETQGDREALVEQWGEIIQKKATQEPGFNWDDALEKWEKKSETLQLAFAEKLRTILTSDQIMKAESIWNQPSFYTQGEDTRWMPGLDSWKPGDPIPESLQAPEKKSKPAFPRKN